MGHTFLLFDNSLPKHEEMAAIENTVSMSSGDLLQDWSSDSSSSHQTQVRKKSSCANINIAAAASSGVDRLFITLIVFFKVNHIPSRKKLAQTKHIAS